MRKGATTLQLLAPGRTKDFLPWEHTSSARLDVLSGAFERQLLVHVPVDPAGPTGLFRSDLSRPGEVCTATATAWSSY